MEKYAHLLIVVLAYLAALQIDVLKRDRESGNSPERFKLMFFLKDNVLRLMMSFTLSLTIALMYRVVFPTIAVLDITQEGSEWGLGVYIVIGACPDLVISYFKRKTNFLRPDSTDGYERK